MRATIHNAALRIVKTKGLDCLSVKAICARVGIKPGTFQLRYKGTFKALVQKLIADGQIGDLETLSTRGRMCPELRKRKVLVCAVGRATVDVYCSIDMTKLARAAGLSRASILHYYGTAYALRVAVMEYAVANRIYAVIAQGLAHSDPIALAAPPDVKKATLKYMEGL